MPETRSGAKARAKRVGIPKSNVIKATTGRHKGSYYIAPRGVKGGAKRAYANCRSSGGSKSKCAKIAHSI
jgi:hypothetical protein